MQVANNGLGPLYPSPQQIGFHVARTCYQMTFYICGRRPIQVSMHSCMLYQKLSIVHSMVSVRRTFSVDADTLHIPAEILHLT